jgi:hypothetical protein
MVDCIASSVLVIVLARERPGVPARFPHGASTILHDVPDNASYND